MDLYIQAETKNIFFNKLASKFSKYDSIGVLNSIENYLKDCNKSVENPINDIVNIDKTKRSISKYYSINDITIEIHYDCELVLKTIHPALAHYSTKPIDDSQISFDLYIKDEKLYLYKNEELVDYFPKRDYHLIQGKFMMQLLCFIHNKSEKDWIGTFHGSTITDENNSILFIGKSGKGKSTLCALLAQNGLKLLADDVSPMLSNTKHIHFNPSAISIKAGAFGILEPYIKTFKDLPEIEFNKHKGLIKYLPCEKPNKNAYASRSIIIVNYKAKSKTVLEEVSIKVLMETLIPDSWISPNPIHAKEFIDWLETINLYQLTYSDTQNVTNEISQLFQHYKSQ
ncbi:hypothetical protein WPG_1945 [Winogradskyella sp. PG-2]|nr:hypothetical protein WPG_1945 [Winogradskyella sp. PG-2]